MKTHARVLGVALLAAGFLAGRGVALALDLGHPPAEVSATTTVGLTPVPMEGSGTREDEDAAADTPDGADLDSAPGPALPPHAHPAAHPAGPADADADADDEDDDEDEPAPSVQPQARGWAPPKAKPFKVGSELKAALDSLKVDGRQVSALRGGRRVATTLDPVLQQTAEHLLSDYDVPAGAVVVMEPGSGRVLAAAGRAADGSFGRELSVVPLAPAASIFKIVTASALLHKGVSAEEQVCFSGGKRRVRSRDLSRPGSHCVTLSQALAHSANVPFAKLTQDQLAPADLLRWAQAYKFNEDLPGGVPASPATIPSEPGMALASTGAGFGDIRMSALHGALVASAVANAGLMPTPAWWAEGGRGSARPGHRVVEVATAKALQAMMELTVTEGTARRAFRERRRPALGGIPAAGKTGSLAEQAPFRDYSWFVGYAPANAPTVAVSVMIMNHAQWRIRASYVGREMLKTALIKGHRPYRPVEGMARR